MYKFWLGITIIVSTIFLNSSMPFSALSILIFPSKEKGLVTTATVKTPFSLHALAIVETAPVPVPPPIPAAIKAI